MAELKEELRNCGLKAKGKKSELVKRLQTYRFAAPTAQNQINWEDMTVAELKAELRNRSLKSKGKKAELVKRLQMYRKA